ncbi:cation-translocating P-type ATPase [Candidatus Woesearchaeota archaeon]|nr:cation-translocating P-type ATPase [Candidatus Woesearchaeota archaeon]
MEAKSNNSNWCTKEIDEVFKILLTDINGLSQIEAQQRLKKYGLNQLVEKNKISVFQIFLRQFRNFMIYILLFAGVISYFVGERIEFIVISVIVFFIAALGFVQEFRAEKAMEALKHLTSKKAKVIREGKEIEISAFEVVPGDILFLEEGDHIPADARLVETNDFQVDESSLSGESIPIYKLAKTLSKDVALTDKKNMVFTGTFVTKGNAKAVVVETGMNTEIGHIAKLIQDIKHDKSPLQEKFDRLSKKIGIFVIMLCAIMFVIGYLQKKPIFALLITIAAVAVSGIPESLPAVVTVTLANGIKKMAKDNAVVKKMYAVETLGCTSVICTDKTGTLTKNEMSIEVIYANDKLFEVTGRGYIPVGRLIHNNKVVDPKRSKEVSTLINIGVLCNNASLSEEDGKWTLNGDPTEGSLIVLGHKTGFIKHSIEKKYPKLKEFPFDSMRKCMSTIHKHDNAQVAYVKGAPEVIIEQCKFIMQNGKVKKLSDSEKKQLIRTSHMLADRALRILALSYKPIKGTKYYRQQDIERDLVFVGIVGMRDPLREGVKEAIALCEKAGIKVVMITGDHEITARTVAKEIGIYKEHHHILTGNELNKLSEYRFSHLVEHVTVYARVSPEHKIRIVKALQEKGHVVAMTGDGVNDAPALKKADIGIAMGIGGTDVAKESADMILLDDHFATIVDAVKHGRTIFENIKKFVYYLLTGNLSEVILIFVSLVLGMNLPLTGLMILFVNLVTSELPALGLSTEPAFDSIMEQKPRDKKEFILDDYLMLKIAQLIPLIVLGTVTLFTWELAFKHQTLEKARTVALATIIFFELFHVFNAKAFKRSIFDSKPFANSSLNVTFLLSAFLTLIVIYTSIGEKVFHTIALTIPEICTVLLMASSLLVYVEIQETIIQTEIKEWESSTL